MQRASNSLPVVERGAAEIVSDAERPTLRYNLEAADMALSGLHKAGCEIMFADGSFETKPNNTNIVVKIWDDLGYDNNLHALGH